MFIMPIPSNSQIIKSRLLLGVVSVLASMVVELMDHSGRAGLLGTTNSSPDTLITVSMRRSTPLSSKIPPTQEIGGLRIHLGTLTMMMKLKLGSGFPKLPLGFLQFSRNMIGSCRVLKFENRLLLVQVLRGFGWMLPAIAISMLLGTRTDTFFMALVLPLAQSAASMAFDALWGASTGSMRPKVRYRKRDFRGAARRSQTKYRREPNRKTAKSTEDYQSWVAANSDSTEGGGKKRAFGGWDDLDRSWSNEEIPKPAPAEEKRQYNEGKLSRRRRNRSATPLVRMLVALFPFLGFWTKLL